ncbi:MAG: rod shape-determining protein MreC [Alphaproteobacteria bacterium]|nr:rod shape-determining protein MreC [Alphaproteobacteria bacterium]
MKRRRGLFLHLSHIRLLAKKFALVILFLLAFVFMLLNKTENAIIDKTYGWASEVTLSIIDVLVIPAKIIAQGYNYVRDLRSLYRDNVQLRAENQKLNVVYNKYKSLEIENRLLTSLLNYATPPNSEFVTARVIAEEGDAFSHSLLAYVGDKKVKKGQVALSDKGVVGRVDKILGNYVKIILITDINSKIPVLIENTRVRGILSGNNTLSPRLVFIPLDATVKVGDRIVTSGVAGVFPAGLPVGKIVSVGKYEIIVKPFSGLERLEYVKLVDYSIADDDKNESGRKEE